MDRPAHRPLACEFASLLPVYRDLKVGTLDLTTEAEAVDRLLAGDALTVKSLKKNGDTIASSAIVAAIAGHSGSRQKLAQAVIDIEPTQLDERPASDDYLVLDADSTQHRVTVLVGKGQNGVVQGPPGTGKSQTIANLIAQSVAEGRRVLFVAEKRAALDAVIKRLSHADVGLGHLVLDLQSAGSA